MPLNDLLALTLQGIALVGVLAGAWYYTKTGTRSTALETIALMKEQVTALEHKVEALQAHAAEKDRQIAALSERNKQLTELVTSAGDIRHLIDTVTEDRTLQREERHRILNQVSGMSGILQLIYHSQTGEWFKERRDTGEVGEQVE